MNPSKDMKEGALANALFIPKGWDKTLAEADDKDWDRFFKEIEPNDHYAKFGRWFQASQA